jgi:2-oxoglutarate dehydrogenase complex dehydrogenase (E1) component-like enzyme
VTKCDLIANRSASGYVRSSGLFACTAGVPWDMLQEVANAITKIPDGFTAHRQIKKVYGARAEMVSSPEAPVDWAMAEALAFGTLVAEGNHVRLSGQVRTPFLGRRRMTSLSWIATTRSRSRTRVEMGGLLEVT